MWRRWRLVSCRRRLPYMLETPERLLRWSGLRTGFRPKGDEYRDGKSCLQSILRGRYSPSDGSLWQLDCVDGLGDHQLKPVVRYCHCLLFIRFACLACCPHTLLLANLTQYYGSGSTTGYCRLSVLLMVSTVREGPSAINLSELITLAPLPSTSEVHTRQGNIELSYRYGVPALLCQHQGKNWGGKR